MDLYSEIFVGAFATAVGIFGTILTSRYRENISTKKDQLKHFYGPLEVLVLMNKRSFKRYFSEKTTSHEKSFIERNIWHPGHLKTKELIINQSHHLPKIPDEIIDLLEHINVWLSEYELIYDKKEKQGSVFAGTKGYPYPKKSDDFICETASKLRGKLNKG